MTDIAHYGHPEAVEPGEVLPDREEIQQGLGRVFMRAVAGVEHARGHPVGEGLRRSGG